MGVRWTELAAAAMTSVKTASTCGWRPAALSAASAASRMTVRMVPSTGVSTDW